MGMTRSVRRIAACIATFAVLLAALAPAISHAIAAQSGAMLVEICSVEGARTIELPAAPAPATHLKFEHCPFCLTHSGSFALPSAEPSAPEATAGAGLAPDAFIVPAVSHLRRTAARPRAPPAIS